MPTRDPESPADRRRAIAAILARGVRRLLETNSPQVSALSEKPLSSRCFESHRERVSRGFGGRPRGDTEA